MAALCPGVQYGLSSQQNFGENKDLIFVKLTDSALRAIYDYIKNQNKFSCQGQGPTIKFLGNEGQLSFPSLHNGSTSFNFSMSSTADMEGPGGSFECVQQTGPPRGPLEVLGSIPYKVRVHANDDVYEATRHRMTIAEENHKNKCTREIKPNQTDIGRKVKLKQSRTSLPTIRREPPPPSIQQQQRENLSKPSYQSANMPSNVNMNNNNIINNNSSSNNSNNTSSSKLSIISSSNGLSNGLGSNHVSSSRPQVNKPSVPDIAKRPIKERLIHLLALRPYKKVELHDRLIKEGVREKNGMTSILKQIAFMKDNCYHLNRAMWNEVNEDWPFYTESEKQMLKRRKPQNLTPPGSSDGGSSGSGQSPTSTHPGSPPSSLITSTKRPGYYDNQDGLPTKRQRISHFRKPSESTYRSSPIENNSQRRPITDSRDASNMNPRSRESPTTNNGYHPASLNSYTNGVNNNEKRNYNDDIDDLTTVSNRKRVCDSHNISYGVNRDKTAFVNDGGGGSGGGSSNNNNNNNSRGSGVQINNHQTNKKIEDRPVEINNTPISISSPSIDRNSSPNNSGLMVPNGKYNNSNNNNNNKHDNNNKEKDRNKYDKVTSSSQNRLARVSPDSQSEGITTTEPPLSPIKNNKLDSTSEFPDYLTEYTTIKNAEQRRRYKADFNADYAEYKDLHGIVEKVSRRFAELELRLKQEDASSPRYKDIKKQIVREYQENKKDLEHQKSKRRFQYLHEKLSHIKRLVLEYDQGLIDNQY